jgi:hypothetical protein
MAGSFAGRMLPATSEFFTRRASASPYRPMTTCAAMYAGALAGAWVTP